MSYSWYKDGRFYVESFEIDSYSFMHGVMRMSQEYFDDYIGNHTYFGDNLYLCDSTVKSLGMLEHVNGNLNITNSELTSLGEVKHVEGDLDIEHSNITSLGKLEYVGGVIFCIEGSVIHELLMDSKFKDDVVGIYTHL